MIQIPTPVFWLLCGLAVWGVLQTLLRFWRRSRAYEENPHTIYPSHLPPLSDVHPGDPPRGYQWKLVSERARRHPPRGAPSDSDRDPGSTVPNS